MTGFSLKKFVWIFLISKYTADRKLINFCLEHFFGRLLEMFKKMVINKDVQVSEITGW